MQFIAKKKGYFDDTLVMVGEKFEAPAGFSASWAVKVEAYKPEPDESDEIKIEKAREGLQGKKKKKVAKKKVSKKKKE